MKITSHREHGLLVLEIFIVVATIALLLSLFPSHRGGEARATRISCVHNLKQVGLAYRLWANDHKDQFPFAFTNEGSSFRFVNSPQVFLHYAVMSNELVTPKILACPEGKKRGKAIDFTQFSNKNVSYFVGLDAREDQPQTILSGDRNIMGGTLSNGFMRRFTSLTEAKWTAEIHKNAGNIGLGDGSVQQVTSVALNRQIRAMTNASVIRFAMP
ncbi:MAG TPA: type II secretion system protein [Candidatus Limnocylindria bacterium]|nr:type II secretion system protein [Candidatus Limnocylindria bacterium]